MRGAVRGATVLGMLLCAAEAALGLPVVGAGANTLPQGAFMIDVWAIRQEHTRRYDPTEEDWKDLDEGVGSEAASFVPRFYYGVLDRMTVRAAFPLEYRLSIDPEREDSAVGVGDIVVDPKIQIIRAKAGYPRVALLTGVRFPTGDTKSDPRLSDGSTDFVLGAAATHRVGDVTGHACLTYWVNGESVDGIDLKDTWVGTASLESPVSEHLTLLWEGKVYAGEAPRDSYQAYVCPGISWSDGEHVTVGMSALVSVAAAGGDGISHKDYDWAPYLKITYRP